VATDRALQKKTTPAPTANLTWSITIMSTDAGHGDAVHSGKYLIGRRVRKWFERDGHGANYLGTVTSVGWNERMKEMAEIQYDDNDEECLMVDEVLEILVTDCDSDSDSDSDSDRDSDSPAPSSVARTQRWNSRRQSTRDRDSKAVATHTENLDRVEEQVDPKRLNPKSYTLNSKPIPLNIINRKP